MPAMRTSAKTDYAIRAAVEIATLSPDGRLVTAERVVDAQQIPLRFLLTILSELRHAGLVDSRRGHEGGYRLARPAETITIADIICAVDGPLASVAGTRPEALELRGSAVPLREVWICLRSSICAVLDRVTLAHIVSGRIPPEVTVLADDPGAWFTRGDDRRPDQR
ncbi:MAG: Rrf2 family transcriptional regulator [Actinocatenispora sp.]